MPAPRPARGKAEIGLAVGEAIKSHEMAKHFAVTITDDSFAYSRKPDSITREARSTASMSPAPACRRRR